MSEAPRKPRGRPAGSGLGPTGPRPGSRPYLLVNMKPGESALFEAELGHAQKLMQGIAADISRAGLNGCFSQQLILGVAFATREAVEIVRVKRRS